MVTVHGLQLPVYGLKNSMLIEVMDFFLEGLDLK